LNIKKTERPIAANCSVHPFRNLNAINQQHIASHIYYKRE